MRDKREMRASERARIWLICRAACSFSLTEKRYMLATWDSSFEACSASDRNRTGSSRQRPTASRDTPPGGRERQRDRERENEQNVFCSKLKNNPATRKKMRTQLCRFVCIRDAEGKRNRPWAEMSGCWQLSFGRTRLSAVVASIHSNTLTLRNLPLETAGRLQIDETPAPKRWGEPVRHLDMIKYSWRLNLRLPHHIHRHSFLFQFMNDSAALTQGHFSEY